MAYFKCSCGDECDVGCTLETDYCSPSYNCPEGKPITHCPFNDKKPIWVKE